MDAIVQIQGLRKTYRRRGEEAVVAIEGLDLMVGRPGTVHGFLGPNGSGKTTTIRCALALIRPTAGSVRLFGAESATSFHEVASRVGAIVESPKMFPNFSGRRNLALLADLGGVPSRRVDEVLEVVGLTGRDKDNFGTYSLGMRQRLAIAGALLKDPDLLILDEPANGLDPAGIAEMRVLIRQIASQGKAVLVSSHQLAEIEQVCDDVTIINRGRLVTTGPLDEIRSFAGQDAVVATIDDRDGAIAVLRAAGVAAFPRPAEREIMVDVPADRSADVTRILAEQGRYLSGLRLQQATLEQAFLNLTGEAPPPPPSPVPPPGPPGQPPGLPGQPPGPPVQYPAPSGGSWVGPGQVRP